MTRSATTLLTVVGLICGLPLAFAAEGPEDAAGRERFRQQLLGFFANGAELSPTALSGVESSPAALGDIRQRIEGLSDDELAAMQAVFEQVPNWQVAPEALSSTLPDASRQGLEQLTRLARERAEQLERFRDELSTLYAAMELLPPEAQQQLQLDRESLAGMQRDLRSLDVEGLFAARETLDGRSADWREVRSEVMGTLPPRINDYARQLAQHGPLSSEETEALASYRTDLEGFFADVARLEPRLRHGMDPTTLRRTRERLADATPETIFVLRQKLDSPAMRQAIQEVRLLADAPSLDERDLAELEQFRSELDATFSTLAKSEPGHPIYGALAESISTMTPEELLLVRHRVEQLPGREQTLALLLRPAGSEKLKLELKSAEAGTLTPQELEALEAFRAEMLAFLGSIADGADVDPAAGRAALDAVREASTSEMIILREVMQQLPSNTSASRVLDLPVAISRIGSVGYVSMIDLNCVVSLGSIDLPLGIGEVSLGSINFNFICNPIEDSINFVTAAVDAVGNVIDDVFDAVVALPQNLLSALQSLFSSIADAALGTFTPENLQNALNLNGNFWENLPEAPQIPCPPDGTTIPFFGEVGEEETASKYNRYLWVFDKVLGLIPDTEVSLALKIPAQVLYAGVEYVGVCLEAAAEMRASAETDAFRADVTGSLQSAQASIGSVQSGVDALAMQLAAQGSGLTAQIAQAAADLSSQISQSGADVGSAVADLDSRVLGLAIEQNLLMQGQDRVAAFARPEAYGGHLELVREVVGDAIAMTEAAGGNPGCAEFELGRGDDAFAVGSYSEAFDHYRQAYRDVAKANYGAGAGDAACVDR